MPLQSDDLIAVERCKLCGCKDRPYYCKNCVLSWNFSKSTEKQKLRSPPLASAKIKFEKLQLLKRTREELVNKVESATLLHREYISKMQKVHLLTKQAEVLHKLVNECQFKLNEDIKTKSKLQKRNTELERRLNALGVIRYTPAKDDLKLDQFNQELKENYEEVRNMRKFYVKNLMTDIFPITETETKCSDNYVFRSDEEKKLQLLEEARMTAYVKGKWVSSDCRDQEHLSIGHLSLPANGDYSDYNIWVHGGQAGSLAMSSGSPLKNPALRTAVALQFTCHCVQVLANILHVTLPYRIPVSAFTEELNEKKFAWRVYKLNACILHLAASQNVNMDQMIPQTTLRNIRTIVNSPNLGRTGAFEPRALSYEGLERTERDLDSSGDEACGWEEVHHVNLLGNIDYIGPTNQSSNADMQSSGVSSLYASASGTVSSFWNSTMAMFGGTNKK